MTIRESYSGHSISEAPLVCSLNNANQTQHVGGKAFNLFQMMEREINVPRGLVVTNHAFQSFLQSNELSEQIDQLVENLNPSETKKIAEASDSIRELVQEASIDADLIHSIQTTIRDLSLTSNVAVRSSAVGEDSQNAAFAGQLDSFLDVDPTKELEDAILKCWSSYWSQRVLFYQLSRGIRLQGMAVIVQELVDSKLSGILFTHNPGEESGDTDSLVVEFCQGYGDELAGGLINPGRLVVDRDSFSCQVFESPADCDESTIIRQIKSSDLFHQSVLLEESLGCPQDIEWTMDGSGQLYFVQTRPITVENLRPAEDSRSGSEKQDQQKVLWSNANVNENYPDPICPLLYSIASAGYYHYFRNLGLALGFDPRRISRMELPLRHIIGVHGGRMYYNLSNIHSVIRNAPGGQKLSEWFDDFVGTDHLSTNSPDGDVLAKGWIANNWELGRVSLRLIRLFWSLDPKVTRFENEVDNFADKTDPENLSKKSLTELHSFFQEFIDIRCNRWTNASLADLSAMVSYGLLKQFFAKAFPGPDQAGLHNSLLKGLQNVVSGKPVEELWRLARLVKENNKLQSLIETEESVAALHEIRNNLEFSEFRLAFEQYVKDWGFRCSGELMLTTPCFQEQPEQILKMLRAYVLSDEQSPLDLLQKQSKEREIQTAEIAKVLKKKKLLWPLPWPTQATWLKTLLKRCHVAIAMRERARLKQALLYSRLRQISLAIGNKLVERGMLECRNDIFYFTYQEIDSILSGAEMFPHKTKDLVRLRKSAHEEFSSLQPDDSFWLPEGEYLEYAQTGDAERPVIETVNGEWKGTGACGGKAIGSASILTDVSESDQLQHGDILVTRQTDPGWGPVFFLIKGLVMERGGMLSHGAILAREFGIPTVVGVQNATRQIKSGNQICVDGDSGFVRHVD